MTRQILEQPSGVIVSAVVPPAVRERLLEEAECQDRSVSAIIRRALAAKNVPPEGASLRCRWTLRAGQVLVNA